MSEEREKVEEVRTAFLSEFGRFRVLDLSNATLASAEELSRELADLKVRHTGKDYDTIESTLDRDHFMTAEETKAFGIIDQVLAERPEEPAA